MDYAKANTVDVFADGMLVHPDLGKPTNPARQGHSALIEIKAQLFRITEEPGLSCHFWLPLPWKGVEAAGWSYSASRHTADEQARVPEIEGS